MINNTHQYNSVTVLYFNLEHRNAAFQFSLQKQKTKQK